MCTRKTDDGCLETARPLDSTNEGLLPLVIRRRDGNLGVRRRRTGARAFDEDAAGRRGWQDELSYECGRAVKRANRLQGGLAERWVSAIWTSGVCTGSLGSILSDYAAGLLVSLRETWL